MKQGKTLGEIGRSLNCEVVGDSEIVIMGLAQIESAREGELTFLSNRRYRRYLANTRASAVIVDDPENLLVGMSGIVSSDPYLTFAEALVLFNPPVARPAGIDSTAIVSTGSTIGGDVFIGPYTFIGEGVIIGDHATIHSHCAIYEGAEIGEHALIYSHCVVRERCRIGSRVILQNSVVVGSDGFGYAKRPEGSWFKIPQTGIVVIEDDVEIGAGSTIDRASIGATVVGRGAKIDNLVQIGHGSTIGENSLLCAQVGLAGSTQVGRDVILSGQVGAAGHLKIGDRVIATAQTGIPNSVEADQVVSGYPAINNRDWLKASAVFAQLPQMQKQLRALKEKIIKLESKK